ncbi:GCN5-related N-acetyltransferase [Kribbella flavida DSM 17836]|uniref:GCN5-related N-acetyltransferase n=1 Tax=Kribbella flavida (strain DSM 17836 / JCM 10339 / NBRC 14399) TaxID=479435 RepID=D2Q488_KRIFD|nr:GNAT family N-acetyltransferase [Kribbella flavida]ADB30402.1 GCN5-related N-acetyltransferase [Kribbella flavida DSM 17836]
MRFPEDVPVLTDGSITLRAHTTADVEPAYEACQDPQMQQWTTIPVPYLREHAVSYLTEVIPAGWRNDGSFAWAIEYDGRYAGTIDLRDTQGGQGEIGFAVAPWARGHGVMTRAVKLVVRHAFDVLGWNRVVWRAYVGNWGSRRVAWKAGFRHLVTVAGGGLQRGVRRDEWVASIGRDEELEPQGHWWDVPVVEGDNLRLRALRPDDADRVVEACTDERTQHWLAGMPSPYGRQEAEAFIEGRLENSASGEGVSWAITEPGSDLLLGNVSVFDLRNRIDATMGEVGYWLHPQARGRGVMTEAVRLAARHAFTPIEQGGLGRRRLVLYAAIGNKASAYVAEANGFTLTGTARAASPRRDGSFDDLLCFDLLSTDSRGESGPRSTE